MELIYSCSSGHQGRHGHEFLGNYAIFKLFLVHQLWQIILEFDFRVLGDGRSASARYANNSNYRNDSLIRKESTIVCPLRSWIWANKILPKCTLALLWLMRSSGLSKQARYWSKLCTINLQQQELTIDREDDAKWPQKNKDGRQELEIRLGNDHISFEVGFVWRNFRVYTYIFTCHRRQR